MGKGRAPCCDKSQVKRGPWSASEDLRLVTFIQKHGHDNWRALPKQAGLLRCGKSCRLRWINYLRPDVKRGNFTKEEEDTVIKLHQTIGNKWSKIASYLPGRTDNEIKNVWNTHLKKRLATIKKGNRDGYDSKESSITTTSSSASVISGRELDLDSETEQQWNHGPVTKKIRIAETKGNSEGESAAKELSSPSMSSNNSNLTNFSQFDVSKPEDQDQTDTILFSDYIIGPCDVQNALDEVNKPDQMGNNSMEIPLESDLDFWNMLDTLSTFQSNNESGEDQLQSPDQASHERLNIIGDACINEEVENKRWLRDLETELGLDNTKDGSQEKLSEDYQLLISESFDQYDDVPFKSETEIGYYHLWPSL